MIKNHLIKKILDKTSWLKKKAPIKKAPNDSYIFGPDLHALMYTCFICSLIFLVCQTFDRLREQFKFMSLACCSSLAAEKQSGKVLRLVDKSE